MPRKLHPVSYERFAADVATELHPFEPDLRRRLVGRVDRGRECCASPDDGQHAPAGRDELTVALARPRMKHECAGYRRGRIHAGDGLTGFDRFGVTTSSEHNSNMSIGNDSRASRRERSHRGLAEQPRELLVEHWKHD